MLCLTRKEKQQTILQTSDGPIVVSFEHYTGGRIRLAIDAPQAVRISRGEQSTPGQHPAADGRKQAS